MKLKVTDTAHYSLLFTRNKDISLKITGNSMKPTLVEGQMVTIKPVVSPIQPGKCYLYPLREKLILHRCIHVSLELVYFMGDNCGIIDSSDRNSIIGELIREPSLQRSLLIKSINSLCIFLNGFEKKILSYPIRTIRSVVIQRLLTSIVPPNKGSLIKMY